MSLGINLSGDDKQKLVSELKAVVLNRFPNREVKIIKQTQQHGTVSLHFEVNDGDLIKIDLP
ncbi:hypothetical protein ACQKPX_13775 [Photobacterium sp. DNB23_23_1]|uniref:Uncharacterized protein n=1 Tax=Photobacterium pectinilyticum TaxID=2906793 RepID=A0ABT1N8C0_9GAMM|nr:hypothetical protein [Photobacterium sp. ZSDE20]MCQ1060342.1 hypothetical protein [Photobacterium sp. ZSDE20]MDD1827665.1 hypothetical protein [Photobacterium sp. ZSDE20]